MADNHSGRGAAGAQKTLRPVRRSRGGNTETKGILLICAALFAAFLIIPMFFIFREAFVGGEGLTTEFFSSVFKEGNLGEALWNSVTISLTSGLITTGMAFVVAYTVHYTTAPKGLKRTVHLTALLPMLLPTITYGFAMIYAFGKQGLITRLLGGRQLFDVYGRAGMMIGFIVYTLPVAYVLISNTMKYVDRKYLIISKVLGDRPVRAFYSSVFRPLTGTFAVSIIQCFFLSFTDYGIPIAVGGRVKVLATVLYNQMLGSLPDFNRGSVIALMMLLPSIASILLLTWIERFNIRYQSISDVTLRRHAGRDTAWSIGSGLVGLMVVSIFASVIVVPLVKSWPYELTPTLQHFSDVFHDNQLVQTYGNSLFTAVMTALFGTLLVYGAGLVASRSTLPGRARGILDSLALVINTIPGMVLGIAYMLMFSGTSLQNTFLLIIVCTIIHYFSTPFLMMKGSLEKMDSSWEITGRLMGDRWFNTVARVITPNAAPTLAEIFRYYFVNAMVTVSAVIFIVGADTQLLTTKIRELEHYQQFNDIFVLSILILATNLVVTGLIRLLTNRLRAARQTASRRPTEVREVKKAA